MQLSTPRTQLEDAVRVYLESDITDRSYAESAVCELNALVPLVRQLQFRIIELGELGISVNQHNVDGARSGASWFGSLLGISENTASRQLSGVRSLQSNPDVFDLAASGASSFDKATLVAHFANGSDSITQELLTTAHSESFESLQRRAQELIANKESAPERQKRLRKSQYVNIRLDRENMARGEFRLLPESIAAFLAEWKSEETSAVRLNATLPEPLPAGAAKAEAFAGMLVSSGGSSKPVVNYHVRLEDWQDGSPPNSAVCELAGVGFLPISALERLGNHPALRLLIQSRNKLLWYSEATYQPDGPLPEFVKRAVKANQRNRCSGKGCVGLTDEIDHIRARTNGGDNAFENLQGLCSDDHVAKTKQDAPWTAGGVYGRPKPRASPLADTG